MDHLHRLVARDFYNSHACALRTFDEAASLIPEIDFRTTDFADKRIFLFSQEGYLSWHLDAVRGITNYDERALLRPYALGGIREFVKEQVANTYLLALIAMDVPALHAIQETDGFDEPARHRWLGIPQRIGLKHTLSSGGGFSSRSGREGHELRAGLE